MSLRYDTSPIGPGPNWVTKTDPVSGLGSFVRAVVHALIRDGHPEEEAIAIALGVMKRWAAGRGPNGQKVTAKTQAKAAAAVAHWEALKAAVHAKDAGGRDAGSRVGPEGYVHGSGPVTESGSAGSLLPVGPSPAQAKAIEAKEASKPHAFRGADLQHCKRCGKPWSDPVHMKAKTAQAIPPVPREAKLMFAGSRHRGPDGHVHASTGHIKGNLHRRRQADKAMHLGDAGTVEPQFSQAMSNLFQRQAQATLSRLKGARGKRMLRAAQSTGQPAPPPDGTPPLDASAVFDPGFWAAETAKAAQPLYDQVGSLTAQRVRNQVARGLPQPVMAALDDSNSLGAVSQLLSQRANRMASDVTNTTFKAIQDQLGQGYDNGESIAQLGERVKSVFADASTSRARTIARTETHGALNESAHTYATNLPSGIVGRKEWMSHHDTRVRHDHLLADGQQAPISLPFHVGASLMQFPGDPAAPPDQTINCRCSCAFLPPSNALSLGGAGA